MATEPATCGFEGNSDMYGLGIRIGIYLQWLSTLLLNHLHPSPSSEHSFVDAVLVYNVALLAVMFILNHKDSAYAVELFSVFIFICNGYLTAFGFVFTKEEVKKSFLDGVFAVMGSRGVVNQIVMPIALLYFSWFWMWGFLYEFKETPCGSVLFFFGPLRGANGLLAARVLYAIIAVVIGVITTTRLLTYLLFFPDMMFQALIPSGAKKVVPSVVHKVIFFYIRTMRRPRSILHCMTGLVHNPDYSGQRRLVEGWFHLYIDDVKLPARATTTAIAAFTSIFSILAIELTLKWNFVKGVYTLSNAGQLIPFVIGLSGVVQTINRILYERLDVNRDTIPTESRNDVEAGLQDQQTADNADLNTQEETTNKRPIDALERIFHPPVLYISFWVRGSGSAFSSS